MKNIIAVIVIAFIAFVIFGSRDETTAPGVDLNEVLDVTVDTITGYDQQAAADDQKAESIDGFREQLRTAYNTAQPPLSPQPVGVDLRNDGVIVGYADPNGSDAKDSGENPLFTVEIDGEKERLIATDTSGQSQEHGFSMGGLLTGYIIGSLLSRQSAAGVSKSSLANRTTTSKSSYAASRAAAISSARARSGSGSHRSGK